MFSTESFDFITRLQQADSVEKIHRICSSLCESLEFSGFIYGLRIPTSFTQPHVFIISGYPEGWRERYTAENYIGIDPTVSYCSQNVVPLQWSQLRKNNFEDPRVIRFLQEAWDFGLINGASFAVHTAQGEFGMFSLATSEESAKVQARINAIAPFVQLFTTYLHEAVRRIIDIREIPAAGCHLTEREKDSLFWAAEGKTSWEIGQILKISERTVIHYLQCATEKLDVTNRQQAVARAVARGLISPKFG